MQRRLGSVLFVSLCIFCWLPSLINGNSNNWGGCETSATIPRSTPTRRNYDELSSSQPRRPPWNPSPLIDDDGFIKCVYYRIPGEWEEEAQLTGKHGSYRGQHRQRIQSRGDFGGTFKASINQRQRTWQEIPVIVRQVPGDANCLFHSIAVCWAHAVNGTHIRMKAGTDNHDNDDSRWLYECSASLRQRAVDCLAGGQRLLFLQGKEYLRAKDLVEAAASQYGLSGEEYCHLMRKDSYWGGGPEIVALVNVLRRPIHVYELCSSSRIRGNIRGGSCREAADRCFFLRRMACFGSPKFDRREPLHILSADSRFPDVEPGRQLASGNHFLAMFPGSAVVANEHGVRGGDVKNQNKSNRTEKQYLRPWLFRSVKNIEVDDDAPNCSERKRILQIWWKQLSSFMEKLGL